MADSLDSTKIKAFLDRISAIESSSGKDIDHPEVESGIHEGDKAIGRYALMPNTIDELVNRASSMGIKTPEMSKLRSMSSDEKREYIESNPQLEYDLAEQLATHVLNKQSGDEDKAAYSWLYGHNLSPDKIEKRNYTEDPYVKKFQNLRNPAGNMEDEKEIKKKALQDVSKKASEDVRTMLQGRFSNTDRVPSGPGETIDAFLGVPARTAISEMQEGNFNLDALKKVLGSIGNDPETAPTGFDIAERTGVENPYLGAALATAVDVGAQIPIPGSVMGKMGGVSGTVQKVSPGLENFLRVKGALQREGGYAARLANQPTGTALERSMAKQVLDNKIHKASHAAVDQRLKNPLAGVEGGLDAQAPKMQEAREVINKLVEEKGLYDPEVKYLQKQYNELLRKKEFVD